MRLDLEAIEFLHLTGSLFYQIAPVARISEGFPLAVHAPAVPLETLSPRVRAELDLVARVFVERTEGRLSFGGDPKAAARLYIPWVSEGMNRSMCSTWIWRCAYPVAVASVQGLLVVETQRAGLEEDEEMGDELGSDRGREAQGWLVLPCSPAMAAKVVQDPGGVCLGMVPVHPPDAATIVFSRC